MLPRRLVGGLDARLPLETLAAWANVKPNQAAPAINGSHNLDAVTDNGAGDYTFTWHPALGATTYAVMALMSDDGGAASAPRYIGVTETPTTTTTGLVVRDTGAITKVDPNLLLVALVGPR